MEMLCGSWLHMIWGQKDHLVETQQNCCAGRKTHVTFGFQLETAVALSHPVVPWGSTRNPCEKENPEPQSKPAESPAQVQRDPVMSWMEASGPGYNTGVGRGRGIQVVRPSPAC